MRALWWQLALWAAIGGAVFISRDADPIVRMGWLMFGGLVVIAWRLDKLEERLRDIQDRLYRIQNPNTWDRL